MQDALVRKSALSIEDSYIVQAPAGSGKTSLLSMRFLTLLAHVKQPGAILAMTFTKKAAHEMKERIIDALDKSQNNPPKQEHELALYHLARKAYDNALRQNWDLSSLSQSLSIMTIDAFCAKINQTQWQQSHEQTIAKEPSEHYRTACVSAFEDIDTLDSHDQMAWETLIEHCDHHEEKCIKLLEAMLHNRDQWLPVILACRDSESLIQTLHNNLKSIHDECLTQLKQQKPLAGLLSLIRHHPIHGAFCLAIETEDCPKAWEHIIDLCLTQQSTWRKTVTVKQGFASKGETKAESASLKEAKQAMLQWLEVQQDNKALLIAMKQFRESPPCQMSGDQQKILIALTRVLPQLAAYCQIEFDRHTTQDFITIASRALAILSENDSENAVAQALDAKLQHIMIDEFQDTSPSQFSLIENLVRHWPADTLKTLFIVGDPMQSIYRFRQADVALFIRVQHEGIQAIKPKRLNLQVNFRQDPKLVDWCNHTLQTCLGSSSSIAEGSIAFNPAFAARPSEYGLITQTKCQNTDEEVQHMIETIQSIQQRNPSDTIAILARARRHLDPVISALHHYGISFNGNEIESLADNPVCIDLASLATCLQFPHHEIAWLSVLRGPFVGLSLNTLESMRNQNQHKAFTQDRTLAFDWNCPTEQKRYNNALHCMHEAQLRLGSQTLGHTLMQLFFQLGGAAHPHYHMRAIEQVSQITTELAQDGWHHPHQLEERLSKLYLSTQKPCNLTLMTCHKSKGLEFDHVIIPFSHKRSPIKSNTMILWQESSYKQPFLISPISASDRDADPIYRYLYQKDSVKDLYEDKRVFYVACTRAKKSLHLSSQDEKFASRCFAQWLPPESWRDYHVKTPAQEQENSQHQETPKPQLITRLSHLMPPSPNTTVLETLTPTNIPLNTKIRGLCIHASLELLSEQKKEHWFQSWTEHESLWHQIQCHYGIHSPHAFTEFKTSLLDTCQSPKLQWILEKKQIAKSEYQLTVSEGQQLKKIIIDRCFIDQETWWLIDYKTGLLNGYTANDTQLNRYKQQLNRYAASLMNHEGYPIHCMLYYVDAKRFIEWRADTLVCVDEGHE